MKLYLPGFKMFNLSIIIVNYNTKKLTSDCIKSIIKSKPKIKFEIIVVDNASTDGSVTELRKLQQELDNLSLIENKENLGFAKANNQAIKKAKGKYVLLLNSDTVVKKHTFERLIAFAEKTKDAGVVVPKLLNPDESTQGSVFKLPTIDRAVKQYWCGGKGLLDKYAPSTSHQLPVTVEAASMAAFLITPSAREKVGFLDERYFMYFEDHDYCKRVWEADLKVYYLPKAEIVHYHGASGKHLVDEANQWRRLIPSSKIYHGVVKHFLINFVIWSSQKWQSLRKQN